MYSVAIAQNFDCRRIWQNLMWMITKHSTMKLLLVKVWWMNTIHSTSLLIFVIVIYKTILSISVVSATHNVESYTTYRQLLYICDPAWENTGLTYMHKNFHHIFRFQLNKWSGKSVIKFTAFHKGSCAIHKMLMVKKIRNVICIRVLRAHKRGFLMLVALYT